jgi:hypothetical protein
MRPSCRYSLKASYHVEISCSGNTDLGIPLVAQRDGSGLRQAVFVLETSQAWRLFGLSSLVATKSTTSPKPRKVDALGQRK